MNKSKTYTYGVEGRGAFPIDMLRYDRAVPATSGDAGIIERTFDRQRRMSNTTTFVAVRSDREPTVGRWASFGWTVKDFA